MSGLVLPTLPAASGGGAPVASPFGVLSRQVTGAVTSGSGASWVPKAPPHLASALVPGPARRPRQLVGPRRRIQLREEMSERDGAVLARIAEHRFLSTEQVQRFVFTGHASAVTAARTARRVLARLQRDGLLSALPRRQGGPYGGSTPAVWQLAPAGARLLRDDAADNYRATVPTTRFLTHCLAVAETHLAVRDSAAVMGCQVTVDIEQAALRRYLGSGGEPLALRPDLYARLAGEDADGVFEDAWFIEVDLDSESLPTLLKKCGQYEAYRAQGVEQAEHGSFPLVLWLLTSQQRLAELARRIRRTPSMTPALYRYELLEPGAIQAVLSGAAEETGGAV